MDDHPEQLFLFCDPPKRKIAKVRQRRVDFGEIEFEPIQTGDMITFGKIGHRVLCGNSMMDEDVSRLFDGENINLVFTSPPYLKKRDYTGESAGIDWDEMMRSVFDCTSKHTTDDAQILVNLGLAHSKGEWLPYWDGWIERMRTIGWRRFGWYVWDQGAGLPGDWSGRFAPSHEFVFHFNRVGVKPRKFVAKKPKNIRRGGENSKALRRRDGVVRTITSPELSLQPTKIPDSVIRITRHISNGIERHQHPAVFPLKLAKFIHQCWPDGAAYDPFLGSGTSLIAAEQVGRRLFGMEISPQYCELIIKRWFKETGVTPIVTRKQG